MLRPDRATAAKIGDLVRAYQAQDPELCTELTDELVQTGKDACLLMLILAVIAAAPARAVAMARDMHVALHSDIPEGHPHQTARQLVTIVANDDMQMARDLVVVTVQQGSDVAEDVVIALLGMAADPDGFPIVMGVAQNWSEN